MKKILLSLGVCAIASAAPSWESQNRVTSSVQAGVNFETATTPSEVSADSRTGYAVGIAFNVPLATNLSLQPEIDYSQRNYDLARVGGFRSDVKYHSLEVPVLLKFGFGEEVRPFAFVGPMGIWNISREVSGALGDASSEASFNPKTFDMAAVGGVGVEIGAFFASARYVLGIIDIDEDSAEWKSRGFKLMAGIMF